MYLQEVEKNIKNTIKLAEDKIKKLQDRNVSYHKEGLRCLEKLLIEQGKRLAAIQSQIREKEVALWIIKKT